MQSEFQLRPMVFALTLALSLAACGGGGGGSPSGPGPQGPGAPPVQQPPSDRDGDGVPDARDAFPDDPAETMDTDGDGIGDNADAFPNDPSRTGVPGPGAPPTAERLPFPFAQAVPCDGFVDADCGHDPYYPHFSIQDLPDGDIADARRGPVTHDQYRIFVGTDQGTEHVGALPVETRRGATDIRFGALDDGTGRGRVLEYLAATAGRYGLPDIGTVRVIGLSTPDQRDMVLAALRMVNAALPESARLDMAPARPGLSLLSGVSGEVWSGTGRELPHTVHVEFTGEGLPGSVWGHAATFGNAATFGDVVYVRIRPGRRAHATIGTIAHELMHAVGLFGGHAPSDFRSIFGHGALWGGVTQAGHDQPMSGLWPADREALRALYSGGPADLGPWSSTSLHIHGNAPHAGFGVAFRNGYAEPWAYGRRPPTGELSDNAALSGSATWTGHLVGFTPDAEAVTGDAALTVDIAALTGTAAFTEMEHWAARQVPGEAGTGTMWGDGDLRYAIEARGQTFRETAASEDAGRLTGVFTGPAHEGAAGTLERTDLTAAFGAARE